MREANCKARMARFHNTEASALGIVDWHIHKQFVPEISRQMVDEKPPLIGRDAGGKGGGIDS